MNKLESLLKNLLPPPEIYGLELQLRVYKDLYPKSYQFLEIASSVEGDNQLLGQPKKYAIQMKHIQSLIGEANLSRERHPCSFSFDGINGSGKSTTISIVNTELESQGLRISVTSSHIPRPLILSALLKQVGSGFSNYPLVQLLVRFADLAFLEKYQIESLSDVAIFDRYIPSTVASEAANHRMRLGCSLKSSVEAISSMIDLAFDLPIVFLLDVPMEVAKKRRQYERRKAFSDETWLIKMQAALRIYSEIKKFELIDSTMPVDQLSAFVFSRLLPFVENKG